MCNELDKQNKTKVTTTLAVFLTLNEIDCVITVEGFQKINYAVSGCELCQTNILEIVNCIHKADTTQTIIQAPSHQSTNVPEP